MLKFIYTFFIGILLVAFVGFGISAFYAEPAMPVGPSSPPCDSISAKDGTTVPSEPCASTSDMNTYNSRFSSWQKEDETYHRNVSVIAIAAAIVYLVSSLLFVAKLGMLSDGLLLGGVFTLLYGIGLGFVVQDNKYRFVSVSAGLVIALVLGYLKFIKPQQAAEAKKKA
ncbi:MAG TPA: hypothetical protein VNG90_00540 [Candidatus Acidoferrum sp.]|nr:hypothetical protein [Candidatus Acidoferrum sp.]